MTGKKYENFWQSVTTLTEPVSFARYIDLLVEKRKILRVFSAPAGGDPVGISWKCLMLIKLEWLGYRMVKKLWRYVKPFSSNTGTLRTDGQTDRIPISVSRVSVVTRDKNRNTTLTSWSIDTWDRISSSTKLLTSGKHGCVHVLKQRNVTSNAYCDLAIQPALSGPLQTHQNWFCSEPLTLLAWYYRCSWHFTVYK